MYYCDKCGQAIHDINKPCPTCGMNLNINNNLNNNMNYNANNKLFNILIVLVVVICLGVGVLSFISERSYIGKNINFSGENYSLYYSGNSWKESDLSSDEYYVLQNTSDLNAYLQFPVKAVESRLNIESIDNRDNLYKTYTYLLKNDSEYYYHNISSEFKRLKNTDNYYISSEFYLYSDSSLKGKIFIVVSPNGKVVNVLLKKGSKSISAIEKEIYELLVEIDM